MKSVDNPKKKKLLRIIKKWDLVINVFFYIIFIAFSTLILLDSPNWKGGVIVLCGLISLISYLKIIKENETGKDKFLKKIGEITISTMGYIFWGIYLCLPLILSIYLFEPLGNWSWIAILLIPIAEILLIVPLFLFVLLNGIKRSEG